MSRRRHRRRRSRPHAVVAGSLALFLALFALLAWQMRSGADPALGDGRLAAQATGSRQVVVHRVVRRVVVIHAPASEEEEEEDDGAVVPAAPSTSGSATPAPAPAPAPLTSRAS